VAVPDVVEPSKRWERVAAVVLAAGGGTRWHASAAGAGLSVAHKLLAPLRGFTVVELAVNNALRASFDLTVVVTGAVMLPSAVTTNPAVTVVHNPDWTRGQAGSLAVALDLCGSLGIDVAVCGLGDQPFIEPEAWQLVANATGPIAVATYDGERRNPVRLHSSVWAQVPRDGDEGARPLMRTMPELVTEVACPGNPIDIDTVEDLLSWS
jgi:molybdenum cofactor cytidylyltransferase